MMSSSAFKRLKVWILMLFWRQVILYMEEGANSCKNEKQAAKCHNPTILNHLLELSSWTPNLQEAIPSWNTPACPLSITVPSVVLAADLFIFYFYFSCVETCFWSKPEVATEGTADFGTFALPYFSFVWGYSLLLALWSFGSFWICAKGHEGRAAQICLCAVYQGDQAAHTPVFCHTAPRGR